MSKHTHTPFPNYYKAYGPPVKFVDALVEGLAKSSLTKDCPACQELMATGKNPFKETSNER